MVFNRLLLKTQYMLKINGKLRAAFATTEGERGESKVPWETTCTGPDIPFKLDTICLANVSLALLDGNVTKSGCKHSNLMWTTGMR